MATEAQIATLRDMIGTSEDEFTDDDLWGLIDDLGTVEAVAHRILSRRYADFLAGPASLSVPGFSQNVAANLTALKDQLADLEGTLGIDGIAGGGAITSVELYRPGRCGR